MLNANYGRKRPVAARRSSAPSQTSAFTALIALCSFSTTFAPSLAMGAEPQETGFAPKSTIYCPGDSAPPALASCPFIWQGKAECVAPQVKRPGWGASTAYWSSYPVCDGTPGKCATEAAAWTAWQNNITGSICQAPSRSYVCTDLYGGYQLGQDVHSANLYSMTMGTGSAGNCSVWTEPTAGAQQMKSVNCPASYDPVSFNAGPCMAVKKEACPYKNPIQCAGGQKMQTETDVAGTEGLHFIRYYSSTGFYTSPLSTRSEEILGTHWRHSWQSSVIVEPSQGSGQPPYAYVILPDGDYRHFSANAGNWTGRLDKPDRLQEIVSGGVRTGWTFTAADDAIYRYDANGVWLSIERQGLVTTLSYSDASTSTAIAPKAGLLIQVTDAKGRTLDLRYDAQAYLTQVIEPTGAIHGYRYLMQMQPGGINYNAGVLQFADHPDSTSREYRYDETAYATSTSRFNQLTGIFDETGNRYGTYKYDSQGRAYQEFHGTGADLATLDYSYFYTQNPGSTITTDAMGQSERRRFTIVNGIMRDAGRDRCTTSSCSSITQSTYITYSSDGNRDRVWDFNGTETDHDANTRGLEIKRIEATNIGGTNSPKRTIETQWDATFNAPVLRQTKNAAGTIEAVTTWQYNARGQVSARCELDPNDAAAMAYTCSSTTAPPANAKVRRATYAYCEAADVAASNSTCPLLGLLKSANGARGTSDAGMGGLDDATTYAYYPSTDESGCGTLGGTCHKKGDLQTITNALGQVTDYLAYDKNGRLVRSRDANGTITDLTYHARGWLLERTVRALASGTPDAADTKTEFVYRPTGQIERIIQPDGVYLDYVYDNAHRLTDVVDAAGNRIHYTLDGAGHRIKEDTFDATYDPSIPAQGLKRSLARQYNTLSRLVKELNAANAATRDSTSYDSGGLTDGFDANGNSVQFNDGLNIQTRQSYDALNRLATTIQDYTGTDPETANATTEYTYDARNNLRTIKDPDALTTTYTYSGLNVLTALDSPDTGHTDYTYDLAGNRTSQTDNRGITSSYTYDALNRLRAIGYPTTSLNVAFNYDESNATTGCATSYPIGRLTRMTDSSGTTTYCYDRRGNVIAKTQVTTGDTLALAYTYTKADRIATITYPSGGIATYTYDTVGRTNSLTWKVNAGATPTTIVSSISYYPFGPPNVLTFGNGRTLTKTYDNDYVIDTIASSISDGLKLDFGRDVMGNLTSASSTIGASPPERQYVYDNLYRLSGVNDSTGAMLEDYDYNKTGDRTLKQFAGQAAQVYTYLSGTHRLGSVAGVARSYDPNGNTTNRGDGVTLGYDQRNRLASAAVPGNPTTYDYSGRGERTLKVRANGGNTTTNRYVYNEGGQTLADREISPTSGGSGELTEYLFVDAVPVAVSRSSGLSYVETDHLGTTRVMANPATNAKEWEWSFIGKAFGEDPATPYVSGKYSDLRHPGQLRDAETGINYNYLRGYDPFVGRYIESDPIGLSGGINQYAYAGSNVFLLVDPFGLSGKCTAGPSYNPVIWNVGRVQTTNNCYSYAWDRPENPPPLLPRPDPSKPQPGQWSGSRYRERTCTSIEAAAISDGMSRTGSDGNCPCDKHKVYLVIDPEKDYHWYRQDSDESWSHKPGIGQATNLDQSGNPILNPETANRNYSPGPNYSTGCGYLCAPNR